MIESATSIEIVIVYFDYHIIRYKLVLINVNKNII